MHTYLPAEREQQIASSVEQLLSGRSVLIFGSSGIGKTHVGNAIAARLSAGGTAVARVRSTAAGDVLSYGLFPGGAVLDYPSQPVEVTRTDDIEAALVASGASTVLHVDDAHLLDSRCASWLLSLADRQVVTLLLALNTEERPGSLPASILSGLWVDERASRIDLDVLDRYQTDQMIGSLGGDVPIDTATRLGIYRSSGGIPLLIRELVREVMESGLVAGVTSTFIYPLPPMPSKRVIDIVWNRMRMLSDDERNALVILSRLEGLPVERAVRYLGDEVVRRLLVTGFAARDESTDSIRQTHRIEAETALAVSGSAQLAQISIEVARKMREDLRAGVRLTALEYVMIAETMIGDGSEAIPQGTDECQNEVASIFLVAAGKCLSIGTIYSGLSFARASSAAQPSVAAIIAESRCLCAMGNRAAARAALAVADGMPRQPAEHGLLERWRIRLMSWSAPDAASDHPADDSDGLMSLRDAMRTVMVGDWAGAVPLCWATVENEDAEVITRLQALGILVVSLARAGTGAELIRAIELGETLTRELRWQDAWEQTLIEFERDSFAAHRAIAQLISGVRLDELAREIDERIDNALVRHDFTRLAILGAIVGFLDLIRGDSDAAETELRLATDRMIVVPDARWTVWIPGLRAESLIGAGRPDEARALLTRLASEHPRDSPLRRYATSWIRSELTVDERGNPLEEVASIALAQGIAARSPHGELAMMIYSIRLGGAAKQMVRKATALRACTDLPLLHGMADYVIGTAREDASLLERAARELASVGYYAIAAVAAAASARVHGDAGHRVAAAASESLVREYRARRGLRRGVASLPPIDLTGLTVREREIVTLVADGRTNREVADALFLSVRTVESHFYQARVKLGALSRQELTRLVRLTHASPVTRRPEGPTA